MVWLLVSFAWQAFSTEYSQYPVEVLGADEASFAQSVNGPFTPLPQQYDAIVVGGGLAGLSASLYLGDSNLKVLLLEKEAVMGGLAAGGTENGIRYCRGAAYWTPAYAEERKILERIGLGDYENKYSIPEPIDSYLWNGKLYPGLWEDETVLETLPSSFALFKHELEIADKQGLIPNQPMEKAPRKALDKISAASWIRSMPRRASTRSDAQSRALLNKLKADPRVDAKDPMRDVIQFLDQFARSALGAPTSHLSAMAFANFYISEIDTRFASEIGTGIAAEKIIGMLNATPVTLRNGATVIGIENGLDAVEVRFTEGKNGFSARAKFVVFAAQLKLATTLISGLEQKAPEQFKLFKELQYAHFAIHNVWTKGHPYRATYDTWVRAANFDPSDFTDVINARWQDPSIRGYEGMRDFKSHPKDEVGILTVYNPLLPNWVGAGFSFEAARAQAVTATNRLTEIFNPLLEREWNQKIEVKKVETYRWPFSLHTVEPGHFTKAAQMRPPFGRIYFANNNLGTPAFEEALFRGHCAATNIRRQLDPQFQVESWTECPLE